jgi:hypothetical protein
MESTIVLLRIVSPAEARKPSESLVRVVRKTGSTAVDLGEFFVR